MKIIHAKFNAKKLMDNITLPTNRIFYFARVLI